jgi:large subunit ribosomal protein L22
VNNDGLVAEELYVSACYADEGITMKRFSPRARGRAGRINKRACHITIIVSRMDEETLEQLRTSRAAAATASRERRVAASRGRTSAPAKDVAPVEAEEEIVNNQVEDQTTEVAEVSTEVETVATDVTTTEEETN